MHADEVYIYRPREVGCHAKSLFLFSSFSCFVFYYKYYTCFFLYFSFSNKNHVVYVLHIERDVSILHENKEQRHRASRPFHEETPGRIGFRSRPINASTASLVITSWSLCSSEYTLTPEEGRTSIHGKLAVPRRRYSLQ